ARETRAGAKRGCLKQLCATTILKNAEGRLAKRNRPRRNLGGYGHRDQLEHQQNFDNLFSRSSDYASLIKPHVQDL
ncbi:hypothetical protein, partial [Aeromonas rivipollensis]|uniref:hypothetical protein n=1 Tax=Aeromonas rivipollensis TaxID=948519 RepID=UPI003D23CBF3